MAEEQANSNVQEPTPDPNQNSVEATIESGVDFGATESTCNNNNNDSNNNESSVVTSDAEFQKSLEYADELMVRGSKASQDRDYAEATDYYSRALEIRVAHYGELAPECIQSYYKYGCALLYKAQEEADPLAAMPKKEGVNHENSNVDGSVTINGESSAASVSNNEEQGGSSNNMDEAADNAMEVKDEEEGDEESDAEDLADGDEDESDLDLAWKMLDVARAIVEKHSGDTMEKVDILSALAEVALEREDVETSLSDYLKALSILERLVEPDSRLIAELNFRICLCLEIGSKPEEAITYCQKAISVCKSRVQRLMNEVKSSSGSAETPAASESSQTIQQSSNTLDDSLEDKEAEIKTLDGLSGELEKKLEDLHQLVSNPTSILSDILGMMSAKVSGAEKNALSNASSTSRIGVANIGGAIELSTVSTAHTNGAAPVTHLGVVGRGVKRVVMNSGTEESSASKKPCIDPSPNNGEGSDP
ncbi:NASP-related protein sim3 [Olea europaea var. sylvestris]|uniref:NASP-related sim3 n=1 Tax=Olea europaea subsp. europaea TaxID=158383 RepID=A0A8S0SQT3_OLEEU|nr:NASP-related protein sim3 [Olea europaea var. sylvestris]CAA2993987.1 NASP-related sim3 [Olea europaea subsp. europaea]